MKRISTEIQQVAREAVDLGEKEVFKKIEESLRPSAESVKASAKDLTAKAMALQIKNGGSVMAQLASLHTDNEAAVLNFSRQYIQNEQEYKELMKYVFEFQNKVNEFLGQKIIMTFVSIAPTTGNVTLLNMENSIEDLTVERAAQSKGGNIVGRMNSLKKIKNVSKDIIDSSYNENGKKTLDQTFQEVWQRYRISKKKLKMGGAAYILWKIKDWDGVWISGAGPLGEAYVAFFVNKYIFPSYIEPSVKIFMTNKRYGAITADNASGFLKGDIVKGAAQFGVKLKGAQPLSYMEIIQYAQAIQQTADVKEYLQNLQKNLESKGKRNMVKKLSEITNTEYNVLINDLEKRMSIIGKEFNDKPVLIARF